MQQFENRRPGTVGSSRIRGDALYPYSKTIEQYRLGAKYDAVIYQKAFWKDHMKQFQGVKIFDICDPVWLEGRPITEVAELVDGFTCSTQALTDYISQITDKPVITIPDRINPDEFFVKKQVHVGIAKTVVWFGYSQNHVVLEQTLPTLKQHNLKLVVISDRAFPEADVNIKWTVDGVYPEIIEHDFVIMPPYDLDVRFKYKSNNKTITSWALGMPVAVEVPDLERFLDPEERKKEAEARYAEVQEKWHIRASVPQYEGLIEQLRIKRGL